VFKERVEGISGMMAGLLESDGLDLTAIKPYGHLPEKGFI